MASSRLWYFDSSNAILLSCCALTAIWFSGRSSLRTSLVPINTIAIRSVSCDSKTKTAP